MWDKESHDENGNGTRIICTSCHYTSSIFEDPRGIFLNEDKFKFQGQSARSKGWFDVNFDCIEENFGTRKSYLFKR